MTAQNLKEIEFTVFLINRLSVAWKKATPEVFQMLNAGGIVDEYIIPYYDVLHTLGAEYLVDDITELAEKRGLSI